MKRKLTLMAAGMLALTTAIGPASAQSNTPVNADGSYVVANDESPAVSGRGDDIYYGDVNTGGGGGQVLGDPSAVYSPNVPNRDTVTQIPGAGDGLIGGVPMQPTVADDTTMTTTNLANDTGTTTENVPLETIGGDAAAPAPTDTSTETSAPEGEVAATGFCDQYPTWYDAQVAYENLGATAADPALVQEVDANYDGVACEWLMS
jgi:hypothetical protein